MFIYFRSSIHQSHQIAFGGQKLWTYFFKIFLQVVIKNNNRNFKFFICSLVKKASFLLGVKQNNISSFTFTSQPDPTSWCSSLHFIIHLKATHFPKHGIIFSLSPIIIYGSDIFQSTQHCAWHILGSHYAFIDQLNRIL